MDYAHNKSNIIYTMLEIMLSIFEQYITAIALTPKELIPAAIVRKQRISKKSMTA